MSLPGSIFTGIIVVLLRRLIIYRRSYGISREVFHTRLIATQVTNLLFKYKFRFREIYSNIIEQ